MMKEIILSADGYAKLYLVPDEVADNLDRYCLEFQTKWIWHDPNGAKLLKESNGMKYASFTEKDFIEYLNEWIFPDEPSVLVKEFDCYPDELPKEYREYPKFNF